jgi:putative ABC transport system substrate-binding protein
MIRRRDFIAGLGSGAVWPVVAHAQQPAAPVIGFLSIQSVGAPRFTVPFLQGLKEAGYVVGQNVAVEYRWGEDHYDRLPALAEDLVRRRVAVIIAPTTRVALVAKAATKSIPIAFSSGSDPVDSGLVASLNRPGGNLTGFYSLIDEVQGKRLELLRDLVPNASLFAYLDDPTNPVGTNGLFLQRQLAEMQVAAGTLGVRLLILNASKPSELEAAFATLVREGAGGLIASGGAFFGNHFDQLVALTTLHRVPAIFPARNSVEAGGLISYGTDFPDMYRRVGGYAGRILKGEKPADLPVQQVTKLDLVINLKTAKALGLTVPETLLATADEVIQ